MSTEICEKSAEIFSDVDNIIFLSEDEVNDLVEDKNEKYRQRLLK